MSDDVFVGLDLGTSSLKGVALTGKGRVVAAAQSGYETARPAPGRAEQDPTEWLRALRDVVGELISRSDVGPVAGIGLTGMIPTLVVVDTDGVPIGPAITWEDDRAEEDGRELRESVAPGELYRLTGQWVDGRYLLPMWQWLRRHEPERARRVARILGAKDFLCAWLTGAAVTDPSTATGFGCFDLRTGRWLADAAENVVSRLPDVVLSTASFPMSVSAAIDLGLTRGVPVYVGAADSVSGAFGLGAARRGDCVSLWGTSTAIVGVHDELTLDPEHRFLVTPLALGDGWGLEMDLVSTGSAFAWAARLLGLGHEGELLDAAGRSTLGAEGVRALPFLGHGEQGALWDPSLRGSIHGLTLAHRLEDVARAIVEAVALEHRRCIAVLDEAGIGVRQVIAAGGATESDVLTAALADASSRAIARVRTGASPSALGAALIAASAAGVDLALCDIRGDRVDPDPSTRDTWSRLSDEHDLLLSLMREMV